MKKQQLVSSYNEESDIFVGKIDGRNGFYRDYNISDEVFLTVGKDNLPSSIFISNASKALNVSKNLLGNPNLKMAIKCDSIFLHLKLFIDNFKIISIKCRNTYGIPKIDFMLDSN